MHPCWALRRALAALSLIIIALQPAKAHTYTYAKGALLAGDDIAPKRNLTLSAAEAACSALDTCIGITFKAPGDAPPSGLVQVYFKGGSTTTNGDKAWQTYLKDYTPRTYLGLVSATLGSHMVLQRAPKQASVWGFAAPRHKVSTALEPSACIGSSGGIGCQLGSRQKFETIADANGTWTQLLPPTKGSATPFTLTISDETNSSAKPIVLTDVLFGDVYLCGGQSNMCVWPAPN